MHASIFQVVNLAPRDKTCFVELSGELKMEDEEVQALEDDVNACIRKICLCCLTLMKNMKHGIVYEKLQRGLN